MNCAGTVLDGSGLGSPVGSRVMPEPRTDESFGGFGPNAWLVEDMYEQYRRDPSSVSESWQEFFADYRRGDGVAAVAETAPAAPAAPAVQPPPAPPTPQKPGPAVSAPEAAADPPRPAP